MRTGAGAWVDMEPTLQQGISDPAGAPRRPEPRGAERLDELLRIVLDRSTDPIIVLNSPSGSSSGVSPQPACFVSHTPRPAGG